MMRRPPATGKKAEFDKKTASRLVELVVKPYKAQLLAVAALIVVSAICGAMGSKFLQPLIDDYIEPLCRTFPVCSWPSYGWRSCLWPACCPRCFTTGSW